MAQFQWTPNKNNMNCESIVMLSPITKTPIQQSNIQLKKSFQHGTSGLSLLPSHITPPSGLTKFIARNPFEADLTSKLHVSVISPTVFTKVVSPAQKGSPQFSWSIDELAVMQPAKIDEFPIQQMHCSDPEIEKNAQEAISRFFNENQIIPSPLEIKTNESNLRVNRDLKTPIRAGESIYESKENDNLNKDTKESWTQTVLSLPPVLPPSVEEILKPYFNFIQDQNLDNEEINTSNTSLRRKLFFENHNDSHNESSDSEVISPIKSKSPFGHCLSPPHSGMFFHGTPLRARTTISQRNYGTPLAYNENSSPCNVSPINNPTLNMSCQSTESQSKARLDFTKDMSIELSCSEDNRDDSVKEDCKTLFSEEIKMIVRKNANVNEVNEGNHDITQLMVSNDNFVKIKYEDKENFVSTSFSNNEKSKLTEIHKTNFSEIYAMQQSNMLSGNCVQPMAFSSTHDTGYQTYSSSNITSNFDSYSNSMKQKLCWDERTTQADDEVQLTDWKENMKNVISSTPSKFRCMNGF
ncbi:protein aurora borealis [Phymastichus coffea]|uniref:protein aurora borealis n=1 Tax=Phymastichus coffea TaxID=108790 RepID=UPI00273AEC51|nr:protein aurora borealis [Phymastichus coffea]